MKYKILSIAALLAVVLFTGVIDTAEVRATDQISIEQAELVDVISLEAQIEVFKPNHQYGHAEHSYYQTAYVADIDYQLINLYPRSYYYANVSEGYQAYRPRSNLHIDPNLG